MTDPYREGFGARLAGEKANANPYTKPSEDWQRWLAGWIDQDEHLNDRDDALNSIGWFG
jgi:ribosome modulation factor